MSEPTQRQFIGGELVAGKYRVERLLGEGGMGIVLAARHEALGTNVAIKLLRSEAIGHTDVVGRFLREARAAVSLKSEHVARVHDVGNLEDGRPYIVMERLEGKDLGAVIDDTPAIAVHDAVDYVLQACEAVAEAHSVGIVHRDLKPTNLFLTRTVHGRPLVKVLDFGISKVQASPDELQLTKTTEVIGSPSYMSPEQLRSSRNVDARTDIWALGVILYELLTGRLPFHAETVTELVLRVVTEREPTIRSVRPDVPEAVEAIVAKCLDKSPDQRFQSVLELVQALEPFSQGVQSTATDRIRAVASSGRGPFSVTPTSGAISAPMPSALAPPAPTHSVQPAATPSAAPSSRINVHGGTSVAWGETQSLADANPQVPPPPPPKASRAPLVLGALAALVVIVGGVGFALRRPEPPVTVLGAEASVPLPPGRKDLPPIPVASASTAAPAPTASEPPAASALPDTRKPQAAPVGKSPVPTKPTAAPPPQKSDDLDNIGRR